MTAMPDQRRSVTLVVATILVTVTTIVLGIFGTVDFLRRREDQWSRLRRVTKAQTDELAVALALPVWNIDRAQIDKILDSQVDAPPIQAVVVNAAGRRHARVRNAQRRFVPTDADIRTEGLLVEERPIVFGNEKIGTVLLYATPRIVEAELRQTLMITVGSIIVTDIVLVLSIYWVLYGTVLRPLVKIERFAAAVSAGSDATVEPAATAELEHLRLSIDTMVHSIKDEKDFTETALDVIKEIFYVQDRDGRFVRWNRATEDFFGVETLRREEHRYILNNVVHPEDRTLGLQMLDEIFERGEGYVELRFQLPEGLRYLRIGGRRMEISGKPYLVATAIDVTEPKAADAERSRLRDAIRQSAIEWQQTFDSVQTPIIISDAGGIIQRLNEPATRLAGRPESELVGSNISEITYGDDGRAWDISVTPLFPGSDSHITVFWDITRIVALQESLRRSETMTAMGKLVGGVAHEVRNPLFGISATLDAYSEEMNTAELREMAATLREQVGRLSRLMQELLEFGKPVAVTRRPGSLEALIEEVIASRRTSAHEAGVEVRNHLHHDVPSVPMDRDRLRQVFENVVDNALQHSPRGTAITISGDPVQHAGREMVEIRVEDEGKGFLPGETAQVFEPFFTRRERGTGLGLSIVQKIVEEHDGGVTASNRSEGGARITIRLPA
jgi:PAS domain S-box-containing protein